VYFNTHLCYNKSRKKKVIKMMIQTAFGNKVKEIRTNMLISQMELSEKTGIDRAQLSKIEQGKVNVTLDTIDRISNAFNISIGELMTIESIPNLKPFVKWAGGKTQILSKIKEYMPSSYNDYYEPFVGGGALLFSLAPKTAYINDFNSELVCVYECLKNNKLYNEFLTELNNHEANHSEEYYYQVREMDRDDSFNKLSKTIRAARMVYLNKACFNGLYRVNSKGYFNVPSAKKDKVLAYDRENMEELRKYFINSKITTSNKDFEEAVKNAKKGDFVYFDPPYDTWEDKDSFTSYSKDAFGKEEQKRLAKVFKELSDKGVYVMLSNHNTKFINELYKGFNIHVIEAKRMINSKGDGRGNVEEVIITNY